MSYYGIKVYGSGEHGPLEFQYPEYVPEDDPLEWSLALLHTCHGIKIATSYDEELREWDVIILGQ